jgi:hypothetical protein
MKAKNVKEQSIFSTLDAYQAAFLSLRGNTPQLVNQHGKIVFLFSVTEQFNKDIADYMAGATVNALQFSMIIKSLKTRIFTLKTEREKN